MVFISKLKNDLFWGSTNFFSQFFFSFLAFKTIDTKCYLDNFFENAEKNCYLPPKIVKIAFLTVNNFFLHFQKYQPKEHLCVYCF